MTNIPVTYTESQGKSNSTTCEKVVELHEGAG
jgi:hypothetical protein